MEVLEKLKEKGKSGNGTFAEGLWAVLPAFCDRTIDTPEEATRVVKYASLVVEAAEAAIKAHGKG